MQGKMNLLCSFKGSPDDPEHHAPYLHLMQALRLGLHVRSSPFWPWYATSMQIHMHALQKSLVAGCTEVKHDE